MKSFYMARHGLTDWNLENKVQGATDIPLNEGGIKQAYALAENIIKSGAKIHKILCSPFKPGLRNCKNCFRKNWYTFAN